MNDQSPGRLTGKVAIVTGGASGIGLATTRRFAAEGARVVIGDLAVDRFAAIESELGDAVATARCDVRIENEVEALVATAVDRFGGLDIAFANDAVQPAAGMSAYCCSKSALAMLAQVAAMELGARGIRVNAIGPGLVRTGLTEGMWLLPQLIAEFDDNAPLATTTSADDVASLVTFLASDESSSIGGTLQLIDRGAHTMHYPDMFANFAAAGSPE